MFLSGVGPPREPNRHILTFDASMKQVISSNLMNGKPLDYPENLTFRFVWVPN